MHINYEDQTYALQEEIDKAAEADGVGNCNWCHLYIPEQLQQHGGEEPESIHITVWKDDDRWFSFNLRFCSARCKEAAQRKWKVVER